MTKFNLILTTIVLSISFNNCYAEDESSTAFGSVMGAVVGGVIGHQFGGGSGQYVTTAAGAVIGSMLGRDYHQQLNQNDRYSPDYAYPVSHDDYYPGRTQPQRIIYVAEDDYLIKQRMSDAAKRRNMIRNGETDPLELPYDISDVQTSWDDPFN